jgi:hypothetical protein
MRGIQRLCVKHANPYIAAMKVNEVIEAVGLLADEMNQLAMGVENLSQRRVTYTQTYANDVFARARKLRENIAHLIPDEET